jgi:hypothetical protein
MNFQQQLAVVEGLGVPPDTQMRMDCPFCQNKNTFTVTTTSNSIGWYCFHASCSAKGKKNGEKTMDYVNVTLNILNGICMVIKIYLLNVVSVKMQ